MGYTFKRPDPAAMERILTRFPYSPEGAILRLAWLEGLSREEIAALTAVVAMMQANAAQKEQNSLVGAASRILNRGQRLGVSLRPGPGSWRRARPR